MGDPLNVGRVWVVIAVVLFLSVALPGCGKKGDPVPPRVVLPAAVVDLKAALNPEGIVLNWSMPAGIAAIEKIRILRSELEIAGDECPGCPRRFAVLADLLAGDKRVEREKDGRPRFIDFAVKPGWLYTYKVFLCDVYGNCSTDSNQAEAKVKD